MPCRRHSSDLGFSLTSPFTIDSGCNKLPESLREALTMKLLRPQPGLNVCTTMDESPILVMPSTMKREACSMAYRVCPPINSLMMEVGGMAAISEGLRAVTLTRNSSSEAALG